MNYSKNPAWDVHILRCAFCYKWIPGTDYSDWEMAPEDVIYFCSEECSKTEEAFQLLQRKYREEPDVIY